MSDDILRDTFIREAMMAVLKSFGANKYAASSRSEDTGERIAEVAYFAALKAWELYAQE